MVHILFVELGRYDRVQAEGVSAASLEGRGMEDHLVEHVGRPLAELEGLLLSWKAQVRRGLAAGYDRLQHLAVGPERWASDPAHHSTGIFQSRSKHVSLAHGYQHLLNLALPVERDRRVLAVPVILHRHQSGPRC